MQLEKKEFLKFKVEKFNKQSASAKKKFKTRLFSSILILLYFVIFFVLAAFSDIYWNWSPFKNDIVALRVCIGFFIIWIIPLIVLVAREIQHFYFKNNNFAFWFILFNLTINIFTPTLFYLLNTYKYIEINSNLSTSFVAILISTLFFNILLVSIYLLSQGMLFLKKWIILVSISVFASFFFIGIFFFVIMKGWLTLLIVFCLTSFVDIFAYVGGSLFGKKKMSPYISPNKTIGGAITGIVISTITIIIIFISLADTNSSLHNIFGNFLGIIFKGDFENSGFVDNLEYVNKFWWWISVTLLILVLGIISLLGDLLFSWIKRENKVKDYSNLIPGHGGILDRFDSHMVVISFFLIFTIFVSITSQTEVLLS